MSINSSLEASKTLMRICKSIYMLVLKNTFIAPFHGWSSTVSQLHTSYKETVLLFTTQFSRAPGGTHLITLGKMKDWVDLGTTQWFWTRDLCIGISTLDTNWENLCYILLKDSNRIFNAVYCRWYSQNIWAFENFLKLIPVFLNQNFKY